MNYAAVSPDPGHVHAETGQLPRSVISQKRMGMTRRSVSYLLQQRVQLSGTGQAVQVALPPAPAPTVAAGRHQPSIAVLVCVLIAVLAQHALADEVHLQI